MPGPAALASRRLILGRPWWAVPCGAAAIALLWVPSWTNPFTDFTAATWQLAIFSLIAAGWVSLGRAAQRGNGTLMLVLAAMLSATSLQYVEWGPWALIGTTLYPLCGVLLGLLLLRWPRDRLQTRAQRWLLWAAFVLIPLFTAASDVTWDPHWNGFGGGPFFWWPTLVHDEALGDWLYLDATQGIEAGLLILFVILMAARIINATRPERRELTPV